jgi:hypothetical protein
LTKSAEKEKGGSDQTDIPEGGDPFDPSKYQRLLEVDFAVPRSVVERTIQLLKRWRKFQNGNIQLRQGDLFLSHLLIISAVYANYVIDQRDGGDDDVEMSEEESSEEDSE